MGTNDSTRLPGNQVLLCYVPALWSDMGKEPVSDILARNLAEAMRRKELTQPALSSLSGVPQTTISLILRPKARPATVKREQSGATIGRVAKLAAALGVEPWQLLHPDPEQAQREALFYEQLQASFQALPKLTR